MLKGGAIRLIDLVLSNPLVFGLQQRICNDYGPIKRAFAPIIGKPGTRLLDIGCSVGTCAGQVVDMKTTDYTGIDIEAGYIEKAAARFPDGKFYAMDASKMTFPDNSFDVCMFIGVLHHMSDAAIISCMADIKRVLKPGGYMLVAEPVFTPARKLGTLLLHLDRGRYVRDEAGYRKFFDGFSLEKETYVETHHKIDLHRLYTLFYRLQA